MCETFLEKGASILQSSSRSVFSFLCCSNPSIPISPFSTPLFKSLVFFSSLAHRFVGRILHQTAQLLLPGIILNPELPGRIRSLVKPLRVRLHEFASTGKIGFEDPVTRFVERGGVG